MAEDELGFELEQYLIWLQEANIAVLLEYLLQLVVAICLALVQELLHRHELHWDDCGVLLTLLVLHDL